MNCRRMERKQLILPTMRLFCLCRIYLFIYFLLDMLAYCEHLFFLDFCKVCYCLRALRQLDCPNGVEALEGFENRQYGHVDLGGATADCSALQKNFPKATIVDCVQSGGGGSGRSGGGGGGGGGSGGSIGFNFNNLWALLTLLLLVVPYIWHLVKRWRARRVAAAEGVPTVAYEVAEPEEDGEAVAEGVPAEQMQQQQQLALEPAPTNVPLEPLIIYDLMG